MNNAGITDPVFRKGVEAIDTGNIEKLEQLLQQHPHVVTKPLDTPNEEGYFKNPYLVWFIADNPIRHEKLPDNIVEITRLLVETTRKEAPDSFQYQISYTLGLVATGRIPKECGVQIELMDLLIEAGAVPGRGLGALAHHNLDAAAYLVKKGAELTLATAVGLGWKDDIARLVKEAPEAEKQVALVVAAFFGKADIISLLVEYGVDVNGHPDDFYGFHSHASALHQAVYSGSLASVKLLVEAGANLNAEDRIYHGTPLGWAMHMQTEEGYADEEKKKFADIEAYLQTKE